MATNKRVENVSPEQLKKIWSKVSADDWLHLLNEHKPNHNWSKRGSRIVGCCIYHQEKTPSFHVDTHNGFAHCFGSSCTRHVWNPVRFAADVMGTSYAQAIRQLKNRYGIALPTAYTNNVQEIEENHELKRVLAMVMNRELREALVDPGNPNFAYMETTGILPWLRERELPEDVFHQLPIGVFPTHQRLYERLDEIPDGKNHREAAHNYLRKGFTTPGNPPMYEGYLVFFYYKSPTELGRFRVRRPKTPKVYAIEDPFDEDVGFLGLNMYPELMGNLDNHPLYAVEGDFDALSVIAHQLNAGRGDICIVNTGGAMESKLDVLTTFGFKKTFLVPDNDKPGRGWARRILAKNESVTCVFKWDDDKDRQIKDVDQAFRAHGFENFYERLVDESNFQFNHEWAIEQAKRAIEAIPSGDVDGRCKAAVEFGGALKKDTEREAFVDHISQEFGISQSALVQDMTPDDTPAGFKLRIAKRLREEYYFLSENESSGGTTRVRAWSRRKRVMRSFVMDADRKVRSALERDLGDLQEYTKRHFGIPDFILFKTGSRGREISRSDIEVSKMITHYFAEALSNAADNTEPESRLVRLGQGVHYVDNPDEGDPTIFVVNGTYFFRGSFTDDGIEYEEIDCPRYDQFLFDMDNKPWSVNIKAIKDLEEGAKYDLKEIFETVQDVFNVGWKFYHHDLESTFLAADVLYTIVADVFKMMVMADVTGVTHSGKTTLLQVFGGKEFPGYRLCESTKTLSDPSAAGTRNLMSGHKLRLLIDEFEDNDYGSGRASPKSYAVRGILDMVRNMASGGVDSVRAGTSGETFKYQLQFPMTVSGIYTMQEPRDLNRFVHIRTQRIEGFNNPIVAIQRKYSIKAMKELRRKITLCWFPRIPELLRVVNEVREEFAEGGNLPAGTYSRMMDNFIPAAAILKMVGKDYVKFVHDFSQLKMQELVEQGGAVKESEDVWEELLHTSVSIYQMSRDVDDGIASIATLIADPHKQYLLNKLDLGAYFIPDKMWLVVFWRKAASTILKNSVKFRGTQNYGHLKMVADMDPRVVPRERLARGKFLEEHVWPHTKTNVGLNAISVIDIKGTINLDKPEEVAIRDAQKKAKFMNDIPKQAESKDNRGDFDV